MGFNPMRLRDGLQPNAIAWIPEGHQWPYAVLVGMHETGRSCYPIRLQTVLHLFYKCLLPKKGEPLAKNFRNIFWLITRLCEWGRDKAAPYGHSVHKITWIHRVVAMRDNRLSTRSTDNATGAASSCTSPHCAMTWHRTQNCREEWNFLYNFSTLIEHAVLTVYIPCKGTSSRRRLDIVHSRWLFTWDQKWIKKSRKIR